MGHDGTRGKDELLVVIHTFQEMTDVQEITIRMISARRATRREQREYEANP